jgi:hypothetical protein
MNLRALKLIAGLWMISGLPARGQFLFKDLTLDAYLRFRFPVVHSFSKITLYDNRGQRIYNAQVILAHQVADDTRLQLRFNAQIVTEIGLANSTTGDLQGDYEDCYSARMAGHATAFSVHVSDLVTGRCIPPEPVRVEPPETPPENCPVVLDLGQDGFHLSGLDPAVSFDIDADGTPDRIAWTSRGGDDAFLCLDRNHNGAIDDGTELFGYATPLLSGRPARIGYLALAELDELVTGGNQDGKIDANDSMFGALCAWNDRNRDGISQPEEVRSLSQVGVDALEYEYRTLHLRDTFGNLFRYASRVEMRDPAGGGRSWPTFDVIFTERRDPPPQ